MRSIRNNHSNVQNSNKRKSLFFLAFGGSCIIIAFTIFVGTFSSVIKEEFKYIFARPDKEAEIVFQPASKNPETDTKTNSSFIIPTDPYFSIVIPKIGANTKIITGVDPYNETEYQWQLTKGVAHAKGTANPGEKGNTFLFAHSAGDFLQANKYNAVFYLLNKLEKDDNMYVVYYKKKYKYKVKEIKVVNPDEVQYLKSDGNKKTITLMTCTPTGTTLQRLLVIGELVEESSL